MLHKYYNRYFGRFKVYKQLRVRLEAGDIFIKQSCRYRSFDDDLVSDEIFLCQKPESTYRFCIFFYEKL